MASFTRAQWATALLNAIGNANPLQETIGFVVGWTVEETAPPGARYNLLNTTEPWPDSTNFNSIGVKNYASFQDGIAANAKVLENGLYNDLVRALRFNDIHALGTTTHNPTPGVRADLSIWVSGRPNRNIDQYLRNIYGSMGRGNDVFQYGGLGVQPASSGERPETAANELTDMLIGLDKAMEIHNPFDGVPPDMLVNPIAWPAVMVMIGRSWFHDMTAIFFRGVLVLLAIFLMLRFIFSLGVVQQAAEHAAVGQQAAQDLGPLLAAL